MNYVKAESSSHYYESTPDGIIARYDAGLRDARKFGFYPSPSTIIKDTLAQPGLEIWKQNELIKATFKLARDEWESDEEYAARIIKEGKRKGSEAADKGTRIHKAIEDYPAPCEDESIAGHVKQWAEWYETTHTRQISAEFFIADHRIGVAGKCDYKGIHREHGLIIADWKTKDTKGKPIKNSDFYESWLIQGAFYTKTEEHNTGERINFQSVAVPSDRVDYPVARLWSRDELELGYKQFLCLAWLWMSSKDYWPKGKWEPTFTL